MSSRRPSAASSTEMEPIHSGHFMKSIVHSSSSDEELEVDVCTTNDEIDDAGDASREGRMTMEEEREKPVTFYSFGPTRARSIVIDDSLGQLKKAINTAYAKMTTPKWKDFKGLRLDWKQRIRLNNVIWRAWFREFGYHPERRQRSTADTSINWPCALKGERGSRFCYYSLPEDDQHSKVEGNVLEGMYWKRRQEAVAAQYRKWRHFWANRLLPSRPRWKRCEKHLHSKESCPIDAHLLPANQHRATATTLNRSESKKSRGDDVWDDDDYTNVFTDRLFDSLAQPYMFPDPKEIAQAGNADIIQPGLLTLQPSLEEIMRCLDDDTAEMDSTYSNPPISVGKQRPPVAQTSSYSATYGGKGKGKGLPPRTPIAQKAPRPNTMLSPNDAASLLVNCSSHSAPTLHQTSPNSAFHRMQQPLQQQQQQQHIVYSAPHGYAAPMTYGNAGVPRGLVPVTVAGWQPQQQTVYIQQSASPYAQSMLHYSNPPEVVFHAPAAVDSKPTVIGQPEKRLIVPLKKRTPSGNIRGRPSPAKLQKMDVVPELQGHLPSTSTHRAPADSSEPMPTDRKRLLHLQAEQSRREALKDGFIQIEELLPDAAADGMKQTNAVVLARAVDQIKRLKERATTQQTMREERKERVKQLKSTVVAYQTSIPVSGAQSSSATTLTAEQMALAQYDHHVAARSSSNPKYYLLARVLRTAIHAAHDNAVPKSAEERKAKLMEWAKEHCHVLRLRPATSEMLVDFVTKCPQMIAQPSLLQEYIERKANEL